MTVAVVTDEAGMEQADNPANNRRCGDVLVVGFAGMIGPMGIGYLRKLSGMEKSGILCAQTLESARSTLDKIDLNIVAVVVDGRRARKKARRTQVEFIKYVRQSFPKISLITVSESSRNGQAPPGCNDHIIAGCGISTTWSSLPVLIQSFGSRKTATA